MSVADGTPDTLGTRELTGKIALVTGSSSGIGRAIAVELARGGADVIVHARVNQLGSEQTQAMIQALSRQSVVLLADLGDHAGHERFVDAAWQWRGGIDMWINNAGIDVLTGSHATLSFADKLNLLWNVDVAATMHLSRLVGARMKQASSSPGERVILNMGWDQAEYGMAGDSGEMFATIKGAVMAFSKSLAQSLAPEVRVNCLAPGWIKTSWGQAAPQYWQERAQREALLGRWGTPQDVANVARFLASPAANFLSGQIVPINGGYKRSSTP